LIMTTAYHIIWQVREACQPGMGGSVETVEHCGGASRVCASMGRVQDVGIVVAGAVSADGDTRVAARVAMGCCWHGGCGGVSSKELRLCAIRCRLGSLLRIRWSRVQANCRLRLSCDLQGSHLDELIHVASIVRPTTVSNIGRCKCLKGERNGADDSYETLP
jgi:hypothetical protein